MDKKILCFGIEKEHEGENTMWFDLENPQVIADYLRHNVERGEERTFTLKELTNEEYANLD